MYKENVNFPITPDTKIGDLLEAYPELENVLIGIAPVFNKLRNPVLRKTIAKITSIKQAAAVGNVSLGDMITTLRKAAGQENYESSNTSEWKNEGESMPGKPVMIYDAREDLENGVHPVAKVMIELNKLNSGETYLLITPFTPAPLIDKAKDKGFKAVSKKISNDNYETYFSKE